MLKKYVSQTEKNVLVVADEKLRSVTRMLLSSNFQIELKVKTYLKSYSLWE